MLFTRFKLHHERVLIGHVYSSKSAVDPSPVNVVLDKHNLRTHLQCQRHRGRQRVFGKFACYRTLICYLGCLEMSQAFIVYRVDHVTLGRERHHHAAVIVMRCGNYA